MKTSVLFLQKERAKYPGALARLMGIVDKWDDADLRVVVVDNDVEGDWQHQVSSGLFHIGGDNSDWEFSGFDKGVRWLAQNGQETDLYVFVTDAFQAYGEEFLSYLTNDMLLTSLRLDACLGWVDSFMQGCRILDFDYHAWLRTSFVLMPRAIVDRLSHLSFDLDDRLIFGPRAEQPFARDGLSDNLQVLLREWLTCVPDDRQTLDEAWHSRFELTDEAFEFFKDKVRAILREHLLSARLQRLGVRCLDFRLFDALRDRGIDESVFDSAEGTALCWTGWFSDEIMAAAHMAHSARHSPLGADTPAFVAVCDFASEVDLDAARRFALEVLPLIRQRHASARFIAAGSGGAAPLADVALRENVELLQAAGELETLLENASALVCALPAGKDVQPSVRLSEAIDLALARGVPVVAPPAAVADRGAGDGYHPAENVPDFALTCCRLLDA